MTTENKPPTQNGSNMPVFMGLFATAMGVFIILASVDVIPVDPDSVHAPRWVLTLAGMMFTFIGLYTFGTGLLLPREQKLPIIQWVQYFLLLGMQTAFAVIFLWIGFGPGERQFSSSGSIGFITVSGEGGDFIGRIMFGGGGILALLMAGYYAFTGARNITAGTSDQDSSWE